MHYRAWPKLPDDKIIPDEAGSLKPFSPSEYLHTQLPVAAQWSARQKVLVSTSLPTFANWDQLHPQLCSGGPMHGAWLFPEPSPTY